MDEGVVTGGSENNGARSLAYTRVTLGMLTMPLILHWCLFLMENSSYLFSFYLSLRFLS